MNRFVSVQDVLDCEGLFSRPTGNVSLIVDGTQEGPSKGPSEEEYKAFGLTSKEVFSEDEDLWYYVLYKNEEPILVLVEDSEGDYAQEYEINETTMQAVHDFVADWHRSQRPAPEPTRDPATIRFSHVDES